MKCKKCGSVKTETYENIKIDDWTKEKNIDVQLHCFNCESNYTIN